MSGIVGYIGERSAQTILINCLMNLEYRGYDSAGLAISNRHHIEMRKEKGRIQDLEASIQLDPMTEGSLGIGHTRWASHGTPSATNSHPLTDENEKFFVVHNGIIENNHQLKKSLIADGYVFTTDTDTEVIPHLLAKYDTGDFKETVRMVLPMLKGSFALAIMSQSDPGTIIGISQENPLILGYGEREAFLSSDISALLSYTKEIYPIKNDQMAILKEGNISIETLDGTQVHPEKASIDWDETEFELHQYDHFMLKEILEQPTSIQQTLENRLEDGHVKLPELEAFFEEHDLHAFRKIDIIGNGTSYHSGMVGKSILSKMINLPIEVSISSEFTYEHGALDDSNLIIILSQSGETADTLSALKEVQSYGAKTIAITNNNRSNIARKADCTVCTNAGLELAVPATKAYTSQITALLLLAISLTEKLEGPGAKDIPELVDALTDLPNVVDQSLVMTQDAIDRFAQVTDDQDHLFLMGRGLDYVLALEGALKIQEVAYLHADAYAAGEVKHGTMALITPGVPIIALSTQPHLREKMVSNIRELKTRDAYVVGVTTVGDVEIGEVVDQVLYIPEAHPFLMPIVAAIPLQLLAYYAGTVRGYNVDRPRNLAKSLTVE
ncbi:glutamine--fructose-6-phosphate transaminase (isomerizing) [Salinibacillus xinjiangensis]|uniref:Glutamine--fructose-6-phosphate aminotransferase [isomerizing] n=1 Tax=Salinibacillus xinjiangensis TaxID=1229268 RepID=A0A6G1X4F2_9BACI|nr:glutamine--fructose-6-phosphate transaminase (isomerizing) [Salinibacillus xinjiangensis]MRG85871.1 glutamine--fructose-6-phosphate transaminase (isomerizing) [Salinibacillus xinjiangensis]